MRAVRRLTMTALGTLEHHTDAPEPVPAAGQLLLEVLACGVGLTQLQSLDGRLGVGDLPRVLGHEIVGRVRSVAGSAPVEAGEVVVADPFVRCGRCAWCLGGQDNLCPDGRFLGIDADGGYADVVVLPAANAIALPESVPVARAVLAASALPTAVHAVRRATPLPGSTVVVLGLGSVGTLVVQVARLLGAARVVGADPVPAAVDAATPFLDIAVHISDDDTAAAEQKIRTAADRDIDVVIEAAGLPAAVRTAVAVTRPGGTVVLLGLTSDLTRLTEGSFVDAVVHPELTLAASYGYRRVDVRLATRLVAEGRVEVDGLIGRSLPLEQVPAEIDRLRREGTAGKRAVVMW